MYAIVWTIGDALPLEAAKRKTLTIIKSGITSLKEGEQCLSVTGDLLVHEDSLRVVTETQAWAGQHEYPLRMVKKQEMFDKEHGKFSTFLTPHGTFRLILENFPQSLLQNLRHHFAKLSVWKDADIVEYENFQPIKMGFEFEFEMRDKVFAQLELLRAIM